MSKARIIESVRHLDLDSTRRLVRDRPALLAVTDRQGRTLLHVACSVSCSGLGVPEAVSARMVNFLLDQGLAIDSKIGADACTPLFFAVARGRNPTLVRLLLRRGAQVPRLPVAACSPPAGGMTRRTSGS